MLLRHSDRGPDEATPDGNNFLYCFNFLTQREYRWQPILTEFSSSKPRLLALPAKRLVHSRNTHLSV